MAKYNWTYKTVGGSTRVVITSGEDIRHLGELDQKMWTVLSCPTTGLEIADATLQLMDTDHDGKLRVNEIVKAAEWLTGVVRNADLLLQGTDEIALAELNPDHADAAQMLAVAQRIAGDNAVVTLADVLAAEAKVADGIAAAEVLPAPEAPADGGVLAAYRAKKEEYTQYFEDLRLEALGLATTNPETAPKITLEAWQELSAKVAAYDAAVADVNAKNQAAADARTAAIAAATAEFQPLLKFLRLKKDFYTLLRNYVSFEDFYSADKKATFQCGTLIIDQRACDMCVRVQSPGDMATFAPISGMYILFCDCTNKASGKTMQIVAAVTEGEVNDLFVGKNAIFYDRQGLDYDAKVTKIIDNPISIRQAFWSPYRKFAAWVTGLINKSAAEKESKGFEDMKTKASDATAKAKADAAAKAEGTAPAAAPKAQAFDIAKFAGIFAAIGMALGFVLDAITSIGAGVATQPLWKTALFIVAIFLCISGPSMFIAWTKLRKRNIAPVLNANGWAINAQSKLSVKFGATLTESAKFPLLKDQKKHLSPAARWTIILLIVLAHVVGAACIWGVHHFATAEAPATDSVAAATAVAPAEALPADTATLAE